MTAFRFAPTPTIKFFLKNYFIFEKRLTRTNKKRKRKSCAKKKRRKRTPGSVSKQSRAKNIFRKAGAALKNLSLWCVHRRLLVQRPSP